MKNFIINLLKKFSYLITIIFFSSLIINVAKGHLNFVFDSNLKNFENIKNIKVAFFGDSHIQGGIDYINFQNQTSLKSFQFAEGGNPLYASLLLIEKALNLNPEIKVVLDLGSNNAPYLGTFNALQGDLYDIKSYKTFISKNQYLFSAKDYLFFLNIDFFNTLQAIFKGVFFDISFISFEGADYNLNNTFTKNYDKSLKNWETVSSLSSRKNHIIKKDFEFNKLIYLVNKFSETDFIIIRPPETKFLKEILNLDFYDNFTEKLNNYNNVDYKDFSDLNLDYEINFSDLSHLNSNGMKNFTNTFIKYYISLNFN